MSVILSLKSKNFFFHKQMAKAHGWGSFLHSITGVTSIYMLHTLPFGLTSIMKSKDTEQKQRTRVIMPPSTHMGNMQVFKQLSTNQGQYKWKG